MGRDFLMGLFCLKCSADFVTRGIASSGYREIQDEWRSVQNIAGVVVIVSSF